MPSKNSIKTYIENGYYHIYNRGVEKRKIFQDEQDYAVFLNYLKTYLSHKNEDELRDKIAKPDLSSREKQMILNQLSLNNFYNEITLLTYCLMPNHFHLFIKQSSSTGMDRFMNSLITRYVMYFNKKYKRVGPLFQDVYKAVIVESESQFLYLTCYIHRNPLSLALEGDALQNRQPSSYADYLGLRNTEWIKSDDVLSYFSNKHPSLSYKSFVERTSDFSSIQNLILEEN